MDPSQHGSEGDLNDLERRIARWRPLPGGLDRDRLMFEAGRASARGGRWERAGSAMLACLALGLGVLLVQERAERRARESGVPPMVSGVAVAPAQAAAPVSAPDPDSYLVLSRRMLASAPEPPLPAAAVDRAAPTGGQPESPLSPLRARGLDGPVDL